MRYIFYLFVNCIFFNNILYFIIFYYIFLNFFIFFNFFFFYFYLVPSQNQQGIVKELLDLHYIYTIFIV